MTDDPGAKQVVVRRDLHRVERKQEHSKQATSVMFSGSASGQYLPPMVVYKAQNLYSGWTEGGPRDSVYDATPSGWFDCRTFKRWFFEVFLPNVQELPGRKVLIGDNLGSHFSVDVIEATLNNDIAFITLLQNSTHLLQPLDVAVFRGLKVSWHRIICNWRRETRFKGCIPKLQFPTLLNRLCISVQEKESCQWFQSYGNISL